MMSTTSILIENTTSATTSSLSTVTSHLVWSQAANNTSIIENYYTIDYGKYIKSYWDNDYDKININVRHPKNYLWYNEDITARTTSDYLTSDYLTSYYGSEFGTTTALEWSGYPQPTPREQLRRAITQRMSPAIHVRKSLTPAEEQETRARGTLRRVVGDEKFQRYLRCGFVTVRNPRNGLTYQCFPGHGGVKVWKDGKMVESWCVFLQGNFPPTDQLITRYLMVLNNPDQLRAIANVSQGRNPMRQPQQALPQEDLVELFKKLKAA